MFQRFLGLALLLLLGAAMVGAIVATGLASLTGSGRWLIVGGTVFALAALGFLVQRVFRRNLAPVGDLIDATRRLGRGDHRARLDFPGPGPFAPVFASFNKMAERLEEEDVRRRRLLADIGHELRTPMTVIRGEVEAVLDGLHPFTDLSNVVDEIDVIDRLLDDLRLLSTAEAGTLRLVKEPTDMAELIGAVLASFSHLLSSQNVEVILDVIRDLGEVEVDPHRIHQVLSNLIANALGQMQTGGRLEVRVAGDDNNVIVEIADSGPGIATGQVDEVFDRFVRSSDSAGTGLGLSISRDLVEAHNGRITAENRVSGGAVFTVVIPVKGDRLR